MAWQAIIPAAIAAGGSLLGAMDQNRQNAAEGRRNRQFQAYMSDTAHQREVADLRNAGLNPILSATGGQGASTPAGGQARMENAIAPAVSSAMDTIRLKNETAGLNSQINLQSAQATAAAAGAMRDASAAKQNETQTKVLETQFPAIQSESKFRKNQAEQDLKFQNFDNIQRRIQNGLNSVGSAKDLLNPLKTGRLPTLKKNQIIINDKTGEIIKP